MSRLAILRDPTNSAQVLTDGPVDEAVRRLGMKSQRIGVRGTADLHGAFAEVLNQRAEALFVYPLAVPLTDIRRIADFALQNRLMAVTHWEGYAEQGFLMFYGTRLTDQYSRAGVFVGHSRLSHRPWQRCARAGQKRRASARYPRVAPSPDPLPLGVWYLYCQSGQRVSTRMAPAGAYRPRVMTADALSLIKRTVWLVPRTTTCITPEMPYSLL